MSSVDQLKAWIVHFYTASGGVCAFMALLAIAERQWDQSMTWLLICLFIDGSDGFLARRWQVRKVLPLMDGEQIDHVIDFVTYALVPTYFIYSAGLVPSQLSLLTATYILMVSAIYYGKKGMVSDQQHFNGFPVLWNLVVFYLFFVFQFSLWINFIFILGFGILHFIPIKVSYPSHNLRRSKFPFVLSFVMIAVLLIILYIYPQRHMLLTGIAMAAFAYFIYLSIKYTWFQPPTS
ncbi:MAG: phosphatidylcholine/phosphatidylserine synthase [Saprospiraceae bacterium]|nr:phosphatidylcholine/phosphatidylserine synthase [Saprospiraceae bacterium]